MSKSYSKNLFLNSEGESLIFHLGPCNEKKELRELIENGGGTMINTMHHLTNDKNCIRLAAKGTRAIGQALVKTQYIRDCVAEQKLLNVDKYRLKPGELYGDESDSDDLSPADYIISKPVSVKGRQKFSRNEDLAIIEYMAYAHRINRAKGNSVWRGLERTKLIGNHSWQSIKDHFLKFILPKLSNYNLPERTVDILKGNHVRSTLLHGNSSCEDNDTSDEDVEIFDGSKLNQQISPSIHISSTSIPLPPLRTSPLKVATNPEGSVISSNTHSPVVSKITPTKKLQVNNVQRSIDMTVVDHEAENCLQLDSCNNVIKENNTNNKLMDSMSSDLDDFDMSLLKTAQLEEQQDSNNGSSSKKDEKLPKKTLRSAKVVALNIIGGKSKLVDHDARSDTTSETAGQSTVNSRALKRSGGKKNKNILFSSVEKHVDNNNVAKQNVAKRKVNFEENSENTINKKANENNANDNMSDMDLVENEELIDAVPSKKIVSSASSSPVTRAASRVKATISQQTASPATIPATVSQNIADPGKAISGSNTEETQHLLWIWRIQHWLGIRAEEFMDTVASCEGSLDEAVRHILFDNTDIQSSESEQL